MSVISKKMKNFQGYKYQLIKFFNHMAITKEDQKIALCTEVPCEKCIFNDACIIGNKEENILKWLNQEYEISEKWKTLPIDTPIFLLDQKTIRHFYKFEDGYVYYFTCGNTSYTSGYRKALKENRLNNFKNFLKISADLCEIILEE